MRGCVNTFADGKFTIECVQISHKQGGRLQPLRQRDFISDHGCDIGVTITITPHPTGEDDGGDVQWQCVLFAQRFCALSVEFA